MEKCFKKMFATESLWIIGIFCVNSVLSAKVVCDLGDSECLTKAAGLTFEQFIDGIPGVQSSEPLYQKVIEAKLPTLYYKFTDAKLSGMKKCNVELVKISRKDLKYDYHIGCPLLTLEAGYELNGDLGPQHVEGKGDAKIEYYDYHFLFSGDYVVKEGNGGKSYLSIKTHTLEVHPNGNVVYDFKNLFGGDKEKSDAAHKWANENSKLIEKDWSGQDTMDAFMSNFIDNLNDYLSTKSAQELYSYEK